MMLLWCETCSILLPQCPEEITGYSQIKLPKFLICMGCSARVWAQWSVENDGVCLCHSCLMVDYTFLISVLNSGRVHILSCDFYFTPVKTCPVVLEQRVVVFPFGKQILASAFCIAGITLAVPRAQGCVRR